VRTRTAVSFLCAAGILGLIVQCGGGSSPTSNPTPVPTATPTATATPTPGSVLPAGMVCDPTPPPLYGIIVKVHAGSADRAVLDSRPIVINVDNYCERVTGIGGKFCDTRLEGNDQRVACDYMAIGKASDTGRWGPTWSFNGQACDGANFGSCANHQSDQFLAVAKANGKFEACAADNVPMWPDGGSRCGACNFQNGDCSK
jgi:hypothetical protein